MGQDLVLNTQIRITDPNLKTKGGDDVIMQTLTMNRDRCLNRKLVDSFFKVLRHNNDDVIRQKLNNTGEKNKKAVNARCKEFVTQDLYPSWDLRLRAIGFCENEASCLKRELDAKHGTESSAQRPILNARMDPYAAAESTAVRESYYQQWRELTRWVDNQRGIEQILQRTAADILARACNPYTSYLADFEKFRKSVQ
ncbi:LAME_0E03004g1_1 [Lachancea meyersii CBS 8951]|uniref:LAME_0E03004g1_1 n=1 Tax=Lachancea meyersii CBS 8951 TaxID=1266667 RepID=A0A1G4JG88_9SACH|nr:LAME_0E03004g1_1 [Lachancea meyersii CBS 8951]